MKGSSVFDKAGTCVKSWASLSTAKGGCVSDFLATPCASAQALALSSTRERFSCSADQFDIIVAFAEHHGLLHAPFHLVISEYTRTKLH
jgi:hypothetical protein